MFCYKLVRFPPLLHIGAPLLPAHRHGARSSAVIAGLHPALPLYFPTLDRRPRPYDGLKNWHAYCVNLLV